MGVRLVSLGPERGWQAQTENLPLIHALPSPHHECPVQCLAVRALDQYQQPVLLNSGGGEAGTRDNDCLIRDKGVLQEAASATLHPKSAAALGFPHPERASYLIYLIPDLVPCAPL